MRLPSLTERCALQDGQPPLVKKKPLYAYPAGPMARDAEDKYMVTDQVPDHSAVHPATNIPVSGFCPSAYAFTGVMDHTDVFFKLAQAAVKSVVMPSPWSAKQPK